MELFFNSSKYQFYNIYGLSETRNYKLLNVTIIMIVINIIVLVFTVYYLVDSKIKIDQQQTYMDQIIEMKYEQDKIKEQEERIRLSRIPKLTDEGKKNLNNIYISEDKKAYLTFDDGPSNNTNDILNILNENNIKATFFVLGSQVEIFPETTNRIYNSGHYIANHGYSHKYSQIYISPESVLEEYIRCNTIVANTIGVEEYNSHLFRFPGGKNGGKYANLKNEAASLLEQNEILYIDWNALTGDSEIQNPTQEYLMSNLQSTTNEKNSVVILMHDSQAKIETVQFLQTAIEYLKQQGYEFYNFYDIIK